MTTFASAVPHQCPSCAGRLHVEKMRCDACDTEVNGKYAMCPVCALDPESRKLFELFLRVRGNLKDIERALKVSYPTVRARIEQMFQKLDPPLRPSEKVDAKTVLARLRRGEITVDEAERMLRS